LLSQAPIDEALEFAGAGRVAHFAQRLGFDLANALAGALAFSL
jgi:hypothetical protein